MTQLLSPAWQQQPKANRQFVMLFMVGQGSLETAKEAVRARVGGDATARREARKALNILRGNLRRDVRNDYGL